VIGAIRFDFRVGILHIDSCTDATNKIFIRISVVDGGVRKLYLVGSKMEKMSLIIKIWRSRL
jgi:hypothetical protein